MKPIQLDHTYNAPYDQDGTEADQWAVAHVKSPDNELLSPGMRVECFWSVVQLRYGQVIRISSKPDNQGRFFVVIHPE